jgi:hypothetical protein
VRKACEALGVSWAGISRTAQGLPVEMQPELNASHDTWVSALANGSSSHNSSLRGPTICFPQLANRTITDQTVGVVTAHEQAALYEVGPRSSQISIRICTSSSKHSTLAVSGPFARQIGSEDSNGKIDGLLNAGRGRDDWK